MQHSGVRTVWLIRQQRPSATELAQLCAALVLPVLADLGRGGGPAQTRHMHPPGANKETVNIEFMILPY